MYKFVKVTGDKEEILLEMSDEDYQNRKYDVIKAKSKQSLEDQIESLLEFVPADISDIINPDDT